MLFFLVLLGFWRVLECDFISFDDNFYVYNNPYLKGPLSPEKVKIFFYSDLFFDSPCVDYWQPVTYFSRFLDVHLFGINPTGHHLTNLIIHTINVFLLFFIFKRLIWNGWRSFVIAAVFAIHPLQVESVAWVTERKDLLCGFFWLSTIWAYLRYVEMPVWWNYCLVLLFFVLGLMSKPMIVTLPAILLVLDVCLLKRWFLSGGWRRLFWLVLEKIPMFCMAAGVGILIVSRQSHVAGELWRVNPFIHAIVAIGLYMKKILWPVDLAIYYPLYEDTDSFFRLVAGSGVLVAGFGMAWHCFRRQPVVTAGWFWFLIGLVPVLGLHDIETADRFTYLPIIGFSMMVVWGGADLWHKFGASRRLGAWVAGMGILGMTSLTWIQVGYWRNSETLFSHTLRVTRANPLVEGLLGDALVSKGCLEEAEQHLRTALRLAPFHMAACKFHNALGNVLDEMGREDEALEQYLKALEIKKDLPEACNNVGHLLAEKGRMAEAIEYYGKALAMNPFLVITLYNRGNAFLLTGKTTKARADFEEVLRQEPAHAGGLNGMGVVCSMEGQVWEAEDFFLRALEAQPDYADARCNLAGVQSRRGCHAEAARNYFLAMHYKPNEPAVWLGLADGLLKSGKPARAREVAVQGRRLFEKFSKEFDQIIVQAKSQSSK
ncbi:MAG: tetratricopeptide repeat protein [Verrucomicrobiae bacterium]|nr:tetratricopeptide repeat protein [Verrucomicrobiae bacterium]